MTRIPKILTILGDKLNGVSLWRTIRPWSDLHRAGAIEWQPVYGKFNEHDAYFADVVYIAHALDDAFVKLAEAFRLAGKKVWVDLDDDLLNVPVHNQSRQTILSKAESIKRVIAAADLFTVSTPALLEAYGGYASGSKIEARVLPNSVFPAELKPEWNGGERGMWRSNYSQLRDMWVHRKDLDVMEKAGVKMAYLGAPPPWLDEPAWQEWGPTLSYFRALQRTEAAYFWKPLEDNSFNRSKSNITMLEGAMCGALTVCNLKTEQWTPAIQAAEVRDRDDNWKRRRYAQMLEWIAQHADSRVVGEQRYQALVELLKL